MYMKEHRTQWTEKQLETIELREKNILVSAAAGSGKTAVLVERIKQLILRDGVMVDRILVVTFTKAAASEMKEKLVRSLNQAVLDDKERAGVLCGQLDKLPRANISTFHSFALDVIRRYFHLIELDPGFKVCDEAESKILKADSMDLVFNEFFASQNPEFLDYIRCYGSPKNENDLKKSLIGLYDKIRSIPDPFLWLNRAVNQLNQSEEEFMESDLMRFVNEYIIGKLESAMVSFEKARDLLEQHGIEGPAKLCQADIESVQQIRLQMMQGAYEKAGEMIQSFKANTMVATKAQKDDYAVIKDQVKGYRDFAKDILRKELAPRFFHSQISDMLGDIQNTHEKGLALYGILQEFNQVYGHAKREKSFLDFSDIEHFAIEILRNPLAAQEYRDKFQYIFIDEYQDSNLLQETIIHAIQRSDNVFMVGDVKQSIYKFRLAEPEIFQRKYALYKDQSTENSAKIDLNRNFRSKESIIQCVNGVFSNLMEYDQDAALYRGIPDIGFPDHEVSLYIVNGTNTAQDSSEFQDENLEDLKAVELEALAAAQIIQESLGKQIFDVKAGIERPLQKKDIVILMHGVKRKAEIFYQALQDMDIDAYVDDHTGYFDTIEIMNFSDLLKVVDNYKRDLPLLAALRSPVFGFTIDDFIEIRSQCREYSFHGAFKSYGVCGRNPILRNRITKSLAQITKWKKESRYMPIDEFVWKLMQDTGYYTYVGALQGGTLRQANLRIFVERAKAFRSGGNGNIFGLLRYMSALAEKEIETGQASIVGEKDDIVRIMTIHKSKGLEFPFVLVASLGSRFITDKMEKTAVMHKDLGIGMTRFNTEEQWFHHTLMQHAIVAKKRKEELDEVVRVLYVAFTRAMDQLVLLASVSNWEKDQYKYESGTKAESNYLGMIYPHLEEAGIVTHVLNRDVLQSTTRKQQANQAWIKQLMEDRIETVSSDDWEAATTELIDQRLSFQYPNEDEKNKKSKYSVSELNTSHFGEVSISQPRFLEARKDYSASERGSIMHIVMEHIDPKQFHKLEYLEAYIKELIQRELLLPSEAETVNLLHIQTLAKSELGKRMSSAPLLHREQAFNLLYPYEGTEVIVQGVIDCWFEEQGNVILIDYKTGKNGWKMDLQYSEQLRLYRAALETILKKHVSESYLYLFNEGRIIKMDK
jgi:ATP-dependent helicase/nuclease subunit A